jgi:hypothetical protein
LKQGIPKSTSVVGHERNWKKFRYVTLRGSVWKHHKSGLSAAERTIKILIELPTWSFQTFMGIQAGTWSFLSTG